LGVVFPGVGDPREGHTATVREGETQTLKASGLGAVDGRLLRGCSLGETTGNVRVGRLLVLLVVVVRLELILNCSGRRLILVLLVLNLLVLLLGLLTEEGPFGCRHVLWVRLVLSRQCTHSNAGERSLASELVHRLGFTLGELGGHFGLPGHAVVLGVIHNPGGGVGVTA